MNFTIYCNLLKLLFITYIGMAKSEEMIGEGDKNGQIDLTELSHFNLL